MLNENQFNDDDDGNLRLIQHDQKQINAAIRRKAMKNPSSLAEASAEFVYKLKRNHPDFGAQVELLVDESGKTEQNEENRRSPSYE
jgi:hypothetical protein